MLKFIFRKQNLIESRIFKYLDALRMTQKYFCEALEICLENGVCENFDFMRGRTHKFESKADDIREEIKTLMYGKALLPESRGDIMGLLESLDEIPGVLETILQMIETQYLKIPGFIITDVRELIDVSLHSCDLLYTEVEKLLRNDQGIRDLVSQIDFDESRCDHIERQIIRTIFESEIDPFQKLQLKELVINMGEISDHADRVSKRVNIISMKRRV
jgi:uncharacterized protein